MAANAKIAALRASSASPPARASGPQALSFPWMNASQAGSGFSFKRPTAKLNNPKRLSIQPATFNPARGGGGNFSEGGSGGVGNFLGGGIGLGGGSVGAGVGGYPNPYSNIDWNDFGKQIGDAMELTPEQRLAKLEEQNQKAAEEASKVEPDPDTTELVDDALSGGFLEDFTDPNTYLPLAAGLINPLLGLATYYGVKKGVVDTSKLPGSKTTITAAPENISPEAAASGVQAGNIYGSDTPFGFSDSDVSSGFLGSDTPFGFSGFENLSDFGSGTGAVSVSQLTKEEADAEALMNWLESQGF